MPWPEQQHHNHTIITTCAPQTDLGCWPVKLHDLIAYRILRVNLVSLIVVSTKTQSVSAEWILESLQTGPTVSFITVK